MRLSTLLAAALLLACAATAQPLADDLIGVTRAVAIAEVSLSAEAIEAELDDDHARLLYEVELIRDGELREVKVDARSGEIVSAIKPRFETFWRGWFDSARLKRGGAGGPLAPKLREIERTTGGRVQEVSLDTGDGSARFEIELATSAGVAELSIDPRTGKRLAMVHDD